MRVMKRRSDRSTTVLAYIVTILVFVIIAAIALGIRLLIAGGDWGCAFSADPALCVSVKGLGR